MSFRLKALGGLLVIAGIVFANHRRTSETPEFIRAANDRPSFAGYDCTVDCSGHEAGYDWAEEKDIDDENICENLSTNSQSFKEGCKAYVNGGGREDEQFQDGSPDPSELDSGSRSIPSTDQNDDDDDENAPDPD